MTVEKKTYSKPEIAEMGRLDQVVNDMFNADFNDGVKIFFPDGNYAILEMNGMS
jgi:hypothetical protein